MSIDKSLKNKEHTQLFLIIKDFFIQKYPEFGHNPSMKKIGEKIGIPWHRVRDWAYGSQPKATDMLRLADTLGINLRWLLSGEGEPGIAPEDPVTKPAAAFFEPEPKPQVEARSRLLEEDLRLEREEMRRTAAELRELHREHQRVLRENADLREQVARLEANAIKTSSPDLPARGFPAA